MKRTALLMLLGLTALPVAALPPGTGEEGKPVRAERHDPMQRLSKKLELREEQVAPVREILESQRKERLAQHQALRKQTRERLGAVLDKEQLARWDAVRQGKRHGHGKRHHRHDCAARAKAR